MQSQTDKAQSKKNKKIKQEKLSWCKLEQTKPEA